MSIKNFRSIGEEIIIEPQSNITTFLGENNIGKSNIFKAIDILKNLSNPEFKAKDFFKKKVGNKIMIKIDLTVSNNELRLFAKKMFMNFSEYKGSFATRLRSDLGNRLSIEVVIDEVEKVPKQPIIRMNGLTIWDRYVATDPNLPEWDEYQPDRWDEALIDQDYESHTLIDLLDRYPEPSCVVMDASSVDLVNVLMEKIEIFSEVRRRPTGEGEDEHISGSETGNLLQKLKNSPKDEEQKRWYDIKRRFSELFPGLQLESVTGNKIKVTDTQTRISGYQESMGMGIIEMITMLTHLIHRDGCVFLLEEPELHLHPIAMFVLWDVIKESSEKNQIFIITHSPYFMNIDEVESNIIVRKTLSGTKIHGIKKGYFDENERPKITAFLSEVKNREIAFSRKVLITEEQTAWRALPVMAKKLGKDFDKKGISTLYVDGKDGFYLPLKLLKAYNIPSVSMCDNDALMEITTHITSTKGKTYRTSSILRQLYKLGKISANQIKKWESLIKKDGKYYLKQEFDTLRKRVRRKRIFILTSNFEGVLKESGLNDLMDEAKREVGRRSKPRVAYYVACHIDSEDIPQQFKAVIRRIYKS